MNPHRVRLRHPTLNDCALIDEHAGEGFATGLVVC